MLLIRYPISYRAWSRLPISSSYLSPLVKNLNLEQCELVRGGMGIIVHLAVERDETDFHMNAKP